MWEGLLLVKVGSADLDNQWSDSAEGDQKRLAAHQVLYAKSFEKEPLSWSMPYLPVSLDGKLTSIPSPSSWALFPTTILSPWSACSNIPTENRTSLFPCSLSHLALSIFVSGLQGTQKYAGASQIREFYANVVCFPIYSQSSHKVLFHI